MRNPFVRIVVFAIALFAVARSAAADDLAEFNAAVEAVAVHNRAASGYLRTGKANLAAVEIDRLREAWQRLSQRFAGHRPEAFDGNPLYAQLFTGVSARLVGADMMLKSGRLDAARGALNALRGDLYAMRKASGIVVLADCVRDANTAMHALMIYNARTIDLSAPETRSALAGKTSAYNDVLNRCDALASDTLRKDPEFRRLIDGAKASLALISKAIADNDRNLLHRLLNELRSYDNLLAFRFG